MKITPAFSIIYLLLYFKKKKKYHSIMQTHKNYSKKKQKKIQEKASYALHIVIFTYFSLHKFITLLCLELSNSSLRK